MGFAAVAVSLWLLHREFKGEAVGPEVWDYLQSISVGNYLLAGLSTLVAYAALAWYDRIALLHLGVKNISWVFISLCSFRRYPSRIILAQPFFQAECPVLRLPLQRAERGASRGTCRCHLVDVPPRHRTDRRAHFGFGARAIKPIPPHAAREFALLTNPTASRLVGVVFLSGVAVYVIGSIFKFRPLIIRGFRLEYPKPEIAARQLLAAPLEILGAAGRNLFRFARGRQPRLFHCARGIPLLVWCRALVQRARRLGVFEWFFITAMPEMRKTQVLAALLVSGLPTC